MSDSYINVAIRIRPCNNLFETSLKVISNKPDPPVVYIPEKQLSYAFDNIFAENSTQEEIYNDLVAPCVEKVLEGYNCTVFAYGQTGTGKTYTIGSNPEDCKSENVGIIPRILSSLLDREYTNKEVDIYISFYEIYNNKVYDLLEAKNVALSVKGFSVPGLNKQRVYTSDEAKSLLRFGGTRRHIGKTDQNSKSSRSHAVFTITCYIRYENEEVEAKLNLVDLAGSESVRKTGNQGNTFIEGVNINQGLHCIGKVIHALSIGAPHIPYRDSKITSILKDSLSQNNYVTLIACVSLNKDDINETVQTMDFAQKTTKIKNKPEVNNIIEKYSKEHQSEIMPRKYGSAVKSKTPWKRPYPCNMQTSTVAKRPRLPNSIWNIPSSSTLNESESCSLFSSTFSSISAANPCEVPSPIIRRCVDAVEKKIMEKLEETMLKVKENMSVTLLSTKSPAVPVSQLKNEISRLVEKEMSLKKMRARSSPKTLPKKSLDKIAVKCLDFAKRTLLFDKSYGDESSDFVPEQVSPIPKTPAKTRSSLRLTQALTMQTNIANTGTPSQADKMYLNALMPINDNAIISSNSLSNSSMKLPVKDNTETKEEMMEPKPVANLEKSKRTHTTPVRRSMRLSIMRAKQDYSLINSSVCGGCNVTNTGNMCSLSYKPAKKRALKKLRRSASDPANSPTFKIPNIVKRTSPQHKRTTKKTLQQQESRISLIPDGWNKKKMISYVLNILNTGSEKDMQKLQRIGPKTATQIYIGRKINGKFKKLEDLQNLPWSDLQLNQFLKSNYLIDDANF